MPRSAGERSYGSQVIRHRVVSRTGSLVARAVAVCSVLLALVAVLLPVLGGHDYLGDLLGTPEVALALSFSVVGFILVGRVHAYPMGWLVTAIGAMSAVYAAGTSYAAHVLGGDTGAALPDGSSLAMAAAWVSNWAWFPASVLVATVYPQVLPYGRPLSPLWRVPLVVAAVCLAVGALDHATEPGPLGPFRGVDNPLAWTSLHEVAGPVWRAVQVVVVGLIVVAALSLVVRFVRSAGVGRWQVGWFGYAVGVAVLLAFAASPALTHPAVALVPAGLVVAAPRPPGRRRSTPPARHVPRRRATR
jgi:two-component system, NarL family, sensor kinase